MRREATTGTQQYHDVALIHLGAAERLLGLARGISVAAAAGRLEDQPFSGGNHLPALTLQLRARAEPCAAGRAARAAGAALRRGLGPLAPCAQRAGGGVAGGELARHAIAPP